MPPRSAAWQRTVSEGGLWPAPVCPVRAIFCGVPGEAQCTPEPTAAMTLALKLASGALRCEIAPTLGGAIAGLWLGDVPVLRSGAATLLHSVRESASYPLVPYSNRIGNGDLHWAGTQHVLAHNFAPEPHAIHGVGWQQPWTLLQVNAQFALLGLEHPGDNSWPFAFDCTQALRLGPHSLTLSFSVTNRAPHVVPMGLGWHPYFVKRPHSHLRFDASGRWEMGLDKLPTQRLAVAGLDTDCTTLEVDHCFDGWSGAAQLHDALLTVRLRSSLSYLVVFTNAQRDFVAIEPVSHVNNALQLAGGDPSQAAGLGVRVLQPGESMTAQMEIEVALT